MPYFGKRSKTKLHTCHPLLQEIAEEVVLEFDCSVDYGYRNKELQDSLVKKGFSKVWYPNSKHNKSPSMAIDLIPYINGRKTWNERQALLFAGYVKAIGEAMTKAWNKKYQTKFIFCLGADWDGDDDVNDQTFHDICHFELREE